MRAQDIRPGHNIMIFGRPFQVTGTSISHEIKKIEVLVYSGNFCIPFEYDQEVPDVTGEPLGFDGE